MLDERNPLAAPNIGNKWIMRLQSQAQFLRLQRRVVYLTPKDLFCFSDFRSQHHLFRLTDNQQIDITGSISLILGEGTIDVGGIHPIHAFESPLDGGNDADGAPEQLTFDILPTR
jgi:hypothetical protein